MGVSDNNHDFGIRYKEEIKKSTLNLSSAPTRCFETVNFQPAITNEGTPVIDSRIELKLDPQTKLVGYLIEPTGFDTLSNIYWWEIDTLFTFQTISQTLKIEMPDFNSLGDTLHFELSLFEGDDDNPINTYEYSSEVRCSYDPNDKLVHPSGLGNENYTLFDDSLLTYTIRFQNTGNDYARNVIVRDTLDENLDMKTFELINTSHPDVLSVIITDERAISFEFIDIYLLDSLTNEPKSHGFINYSISPYQ